jgi:acetyl esterase/lipase
MLASAPLDPRARRVLMMLAVGGEAEVMDPIAARREGLEALARMAGGAGAPQMPVEQRLINGPESPLAVRIYRPQAASAAALLFLHGGGWVAGSLETHDGVCRRLAEASGRTVFALDYRLAPEHPAPAALGDARACLDWLIAQADALGIDPARIAVAGDSAGGSLAGGLCRSRSGLVERLLLICPILDLAGESPSRITFGAGHFVEREAFQLDLQRYCPDPDLRHDADLSPLAGSVPSDFPPILIHVAGHDPFRDEGVAFARQLEQQGVSVELTASPGLIHYFYALPGLFPQADQVLAELGAWLKAD